MSKKMQKLLAEYGYTHSGQYFLLIINSYHNGQLSQAWEQFDAMPLSGKEDFLDRCGNMGDLFIYLFKKQLAKTAEDN